MKKQIASLAVILLAVSSLAFYGCGAEESSEGDGADDLGEDVGTGEEEGEGGALEEGEEGEEGEGSNP